MPLSCPILPLSANAPMGLNPISLVEGLVTRFPTVARFQILQSVFGTQTGRCSWYKTFYSCMNNILKGQWFREAVRHGSGSSAATRPRRQQPLAGSCWVSGGPPSSTLSLSPWVLTAFSLPAASWQCGIMATHRFATYSFGGE